VTSHAVTLIHDGVTTIAPRGEPQGDELWLPLDDLEADVGWELKPEGVCQGETCVPLGVERRQAMLRQGGSTTWFNVTEFARLIEQPVALDRDEQVWSFGPPGWEWKSQGEGLTAPDFSAPDLAGRPHSLRELLGKKVFLLFWASW
jgi:hypothetical protein